MKVGGRALAAPLFVALVALAWGCSADVGGGPTVLGPARGGTGGVAGSGSADGSATGADVASRGADGIATPEADGSPGAEPTGDTPRALEPEPTADAQSEPQPDLLPAPDAPEPDAPEPNAPEPDAPGPDAPDAPDAPDGGPEGGDGDPDCIVDSDCEGESACVNMTCIDEECVAALLANYCLIDDECWESAESPDDDQCLVCAPLLDAYHWIDKGCGDGNSCTVDSCDPDHGCVHVSTGVSELCNAKDDDCDGKTDEDFPVGEACDSGDVDECAYGTYWCSNDGSSVVCPSSSESPKDLVELCNDVDDDCDGQTDEDFAVGEPCDGPDADKCAEGFTTCVGGDIVCSDDATSQPEVCGNLKDDDCDGLADCLDSPCKGAGSCAKTCATSADCDDGNPCSTDSCVGSETKKCSHSAKGCSDGNPCTADTCSLSSGACQHQNLADGTVCTDGTACTAGDQCLSGSCTSGALKTSPSSSPGVFPGTKLSNIDDDCGDYGFDTVVAPEGDLLWFWGHIDDSPFCQVDLDFSYSAYGPEPWATEVCLYFSCDNPSNCSPTCDAGSSGYSSTVGASGCCKTASSGHVTIETGGDFFSSQAGTFYLSVQSPSAPACLDFDITP